MVAEVYAGQNDVVVKTKSLDVVYADDFIDSRQEQPAWQAFQAVSSGLPILMPV
jgi:hypothetical protein